jgi:hypothetical protein
LVLGTLEGQEGRETSQEAISIIQGRGDDGLEQVAGVEKSLDSGWIWKSQ